jgi:hypothetical protein
MFVVSRTHRAVICAARNLIAAGNCAGLVVLGMTASFLQADRRRAHDEARADRGKYTPSRFDCNDSSTLNLIN